MTSTEVLSPPHHAAVPLAADASQLKLDALNLPLGSTHLVGGAVELSNTQIGDVATFARSSFRNEAVKAGAVSVVFGSLRHLVLFRFLSNGTGLLAELCCTCRLVVPGMPKVLKACVNANMRRSGFSFRAVGHRWHARHEGRGPGGGCPGQLECAAGGQGPGPCSA